MAEPQTTEYVILTRAGESVAWFESGKETAASATQAIRQHLAKEADVDAQFVATPARSWKPVAVKTRVALDFGEATS